MESLRRGKCRQFLQGYVRPRKRLHAYLLTLLTHLITCLLNLLAHSLTWSLTHIATYALHPSPTLTHPHELTHSLIYPLTLTWHFTHCLFSRSVYSDRVTHCTCSLNNSLTHFSSWLTQYLSHSLAIIYSPTHSLACSVIHLLTHSLAYVRTHPLSLTR